MNMLRALFVIATLSLAAALQPTRAEAQYPDFDLDLGADVGRIVGTGVVALGALTLTIADVVSFANDAPFDRGWAGVEVLLAIASAGTALYAIHYGATHDQLPFSVGGGIVLAMSITNIAHAVWSMVELGGPPSRAPSSPPRAPSF